MSKLPFSKYVERGGFVFTSGQVYLKDGVLVDGDVKKRTDQVMQNLRDVLTEAGAGFEDVVKTTIYLTNMEIYGKVSEVYGSYFSGDDYPAREMVAVKALPLGAEIEISMIAHKGNE